MREKMNDEQKKMLDDFKSRNDFYFFKKNMLNKRMSGQAISRLKTDLRLTWYRTGLTQDEILDYLKVTKYLMEKKYKRTYLPRPRELRHAKKDDPQIVMFLEKHKTEINFKKTTTARYIWTQEFKKDIIKLWKDTLYTQQSILKCLELPPKTEFKINREFKIKRENRTQT